jgi:hypothetical protein
VSPLITRFALYGVLGVGLVAMIGLGYRHYTGLLEKVTKLSSEKVSLQTSLRDEKATSEKLRANSWRWKHSYDKLVVSHAEAQRQAERATAEARRLDQLFGRHDLEALALAKPRLVQNRVNAASDSALRLLSCATTPGCIDDGGTRATDDAAAGPPGPGRDAAAGVDRAPRR